MHVFVTGASGFIGSAVLRELLDAGHSVTGLARSDSSEAKLRTMGAEAHRGQLDDLESLAAGARASDAVIHLGFVHDTGDFIAAAETDRRAIAAMGDALAGSGKTFVGTSGTMLLTPGRVGTEDDAADPQSAAAFRVASEELMLALSERGVRTSVVRPAPTVHGDGDHGFVSMLIAMARAKGVSPYIGDGLNRWPAVHRLDAARVFKLALEKGTSGARYHAVGEGEIPFRDIAEAIGAGLGIPAASQSMEAAMEHFGGLAFVVSADNPASSALTRERLGWNPNHPSLLADLAGPSYFSA